LAGKVNNRLHGPRNLVNQLIGVGELLARSIFTWV